MTIFLKDLAEDPTLLDRLRCDHSATINSVDYDLEDRMYEELGVVVEQNPIPSGRKR